MTIRKLLIGFGVIVAAAVAAHGAYWWILADGLGGAFTAWVEDRRAAGWDVRHAEPEIGGYPMRARATIGDPVIAGPGDPPRWQWRGPGLVLEIDPWRPREIRFSSPGRHRLMANHGGRAEAAEVAAGSIDGIARLAPSGRIGSIAFDAASIDAVRHGNPGRLRIGRLEAVLTMPDRRGEEAAAPNGEEPAGPIVSLSAADVVLPDGPRYPFGHTARVIEVEVKLLGDVVLRPTLTATLAAWRDGGGTVEVRRLDVQWGAFELAGEGTLALDGALQPVAAMTARVGGYREIVDALVETGHVRGRDAMVTKLVLAVIARATPGGTSRLTVPVTVQNGTLSAGPARLMRLPRIDWGAVSGE